jgi:hypothetical protein
VLRITSSNGKSSICVVNFNQEIYCFEYDENYNIPEYKIENLEILTVTLDNITKYLIFNTSGNVHSLNPEEFKRIQKEFFKVYYATI